MIIRFYHYYYLLREFLMYFPFYDEMQLPANLEERRDFLLNVILF